LTLSINGDVSHDVVHLKIPEKMNPNSPKWESLVVVVERRYRRKKARINPNVHLTTNLIG
jgi:hypothetical protein